tara:strand:+ start:283 stop:630 length:348 start_codon:yes stop_codon:yes gene_type:complete
MKSEEYKKFREQFIKKTFDLSDTKRIEYTEGNQDLDVHTNFRRIGDELNMNPVKVLAVYLIKHIKSLMTFFKLGQTFSNETLESRVSDIINYLILLLSYLHYEDMKERDDTPEKR